MCDELSVDRISLHSINETEAHFRVIASAGSPILAVGTELPIESSTQVALPASGRVFRRSNFEDESFAAALDRLVCDLGFRAGVSVPLFLGSRPIGALAASCVEGNLDCDPILKVMDGVAASMALALHSRWSVQGCRVAVCHDDLVTAQGLARIVEHALDATVRVCSSLEALAGTADNSPMSRELLVCDMVLGGRRLDEFLPEARAGGVAGPVLVIATTPSRQARMLAVRSGVLGFVARSAGPAAIEQALHDVHAGRAHGLAGAGIETSEDPPLAIDLTLQESRVLVLLDQGLRFRQIASEMRISESTAKGYARNLFGKLGATSRSEAVYFARRCGLLGQLASGGELRELSGVP
jgi:DNA-binding NarL/FixJ family response regulator